MKNTPTSTKPFYQDWRLWAVVAGAVIIVAAVCCIMLIGSNSDKGLAENATNSELDEITNKYIAYCEKNWPKNDCNKIVNRLKAEYTIEELRNGQHENGDFDYWELPKFRVIEYCGHRNDVSNDQNDCTQFGDYSGPNTSGSSSSSSNPDPNPNNSSSNSSTSTSSTDWKKWLSDYEAWVDKYIEVYNKYKNNPTDSSLYSEYMSLMADMTKWSEQSSNLQNNLTASDYAEFLETYSRIANKLNGLY